MAVSRGLGTFSATWRTAAGNEGRPVGGMGVWVLEDDAIFGRRMHREQASLVAILRQREWNYAFLPPTRERGFHLAALLRRACAGTAPYSGAYGRERSNFLLATRKGVNSILTGHSCCFAGSTRTR